MTHSDLDIAAKETTQIIANPDAPIHLKFDISEVMHRFVQHRDGSQELFVSHLDQETEPQPRSHP